MIEILHKRFRTVYLNKEKHSIHITVWPDSEMKRSLFIRDPGPLSSTMLHTKCSDLNSGAQMLPFW